MGNLLPPAFYGLLLLVVAIHFIWKRYFGSSSQQKKRVAYVKEIRTHPVKSAGPLLMDKIEMTDIGMKFDRFVWGVFFSFRKKCVKPILCVDIKTTLLRHK